jgi:AcrR family transcriptional regulator
MDDRTLTPAAERLLDAAMRLFAQKGYEETTVGEIQEAAGLTFGSGALYKHFASKEAVLSEGVDRLLAAARRQQAELGLPDDRAIPEALRAMAQSAMKAFAAEKDLLRIAWRDLDPFPELQEKVRTERIRTSFDEFASWLAHQDAEGRVSTHDPAAVAAVAFSALAFFALLSVLLHDTPGGLSEERFVTAWSELFAYALT